MTIVFAGHFTVGEKISAVQLATIDRAKKSGAELGIVVNDIDIKRKLLFFKSGGRDSVIRHYLSRRKCGVTAPLCDVPTAVEIGALIDWDFYQNATLAGGNLNTESAIRTELVPAVIAQRLHAYGLDLAEVKVFTERGLRNLANARLLDSRKKGPKSWLPQLQDIDELANVQARLSQVPTCGGIMLALYEKVADLGFSKLIQLYSDQDRGAIENGTRIMHALKKHAPQDPRWQLDIENYFFDWNGSLL